MFDAVTISKYGGVVATLILAGFGLPIPEEIPIVTAGAMVGHDAQELANHEYWVGSVGGGPLAYLDPDPQGVTRWWIMLPLCILGAVLGDAVLYGGGRFFGRRLLKIGWVRRNLLPQDKQQKIEANFAKNGILILLGARFTPGVRSPVFIMAGVLKMPLSRFLLADALYAIPGINVLFWLAYVFTDQFRDAVYAVERHRSMAIVAILAAVAGVVIYRFFTTRKLSTGDPADIPLYNKPVGAVTRVVEQTIEKAVQATAHAFPIVVDKVTHPLGHNPPAASPDVAASAPPAPVPVGSPAADRPAVPD